MSRWAANHVEEIEEELCKIAEKRGLVPDGKDPYEAVDDIRKNWGWMFDDLWLEAFQNAWEKAHDCYIDE